MSVVVTDYGGTVLTNVDVYLIFWGSAWNPPTGGPGSGPSASATVHAVGQIVEGPFLAGLSQYRGVGPGKIVGAIIASPSTNGIADPPNQFRDDGVVQDPQTLLLKPLLNSGILPAPSTDPQLLYVIFMPPGVVEVAEINGQLQPSGVFGQHSCFPYGSVTAHYAWVTTDTKLQDGIGTFSHELVEGCTDPGVFCNDLGFGTNVGDGELADACQQNAEVNGVPVSDGGFVNLNGYNVQRYWSKADNRCIAGYQVDWSLLGQPVQANFQDFTPVVASNKDGRLEVFIIGNDGNLWHIWQNSPNGGWDTWADPATNLGHPAGVSFLGSAVALNSNQDGRLEVFIVGSDGNLWHVWQTIPNDGWSNWESPGAKLGQPNGAGLSNSFAVGKNPDGRLEVFILDVNGNLWHMWQAQPNDGWSTWGDPVANLGQPLGVSFEGGPSVINNAGGYLEVFLIGSDGNLWHTWQIAHGWNPWSDPTANLSQPARVILDEGPSVGINQNGRLEVFCIGNDNNLWHIWQTVPNNGWGGWESLSQPLPLPPSWTQLIISSPVVGSNGDGHLEVFVLDLNGNLWHIWQRGPNARFGNWYSLGQPFPSANNTQLVSALGLGTNQNGRLEIFCISENQSLWHAWQIRPDGPWTYGTPA